MRDKQSHLGDSVKYAGNALLTVLLALLLISTRNASGQETVIDSFLNNSIDGEYPTGSLFMDAKGNLYGTTQKGGTLTSGGTVFELSPAEGGGWTEKIIHEFNGDQAAGDGANPTGALISDAKGNLFGTTSSGGANIYYGTVFELSPEANGDWTEKVLYSFGASATDGTVPLGNLIFDSKGNLYGTTETGGANSGGDGGQQGYGTAFELVLSGSGSWTEKVIYSFGATDNDGTRPEAGLVFDSSGRLYGTTALGGHYSNRTTEGGTVFELIPETNGEWQEKLLYEFDPVRAKGDGSFPAASLIFDSKGNLFGTTQLGGSGDAGTVFELSPAADGGWAETILYLYTGSTSGYEPSSALTIDSKGNLYGTAPAGGLYASSDGYGGTVFEITPQSDGTWMETVLHNFSTPPPGGGTSTDGTAPYGSVIFDPKGNLYGTTEYGGTNHVGTVYEISPSTSTPTLTLSVSPSTLTFASLTEGATSAAQLVTLKNTGTAAVTLDTPTITGTNSSSFLKSATTCESTLASGASCTISIEFKPVTTGALSASLSIADDATGSPQLVTLKGTATASSALTITVAPTTLTFASIAEGSTSAPQLITLKNTSKTAVTLGATSFTGTNTQSFIKSATTCTATVAAGTSCSISIEFHPAVTGSLSAALNITDNATGSPQLVALKGTSTAAAPTYTLTVTPTALTFASLAEGSTSPAQTITLKNTGTGTLTLGTPTFTGTNPKSFLISSKTCAATLAVSASCTISVEFKPAVTGSLTATLSIPSNATSSPNLVALKGTSTAAAPTYTLTVTPTALTFASLSDGSTSPAQTVTLKNTGTGTLTLGTPTFTGTNPKSFLISTKTCSTSLAAGASCTVSIESKPAVTGALSASLSIPGNATGSPQLVTLKGTATAAK